MTTTDDLRRRTRLTDLDGPPRVRCSNCGALGPRLSSEWRMAGTHWQHKCPDAIPQAGHFPCEWLESPDA